MAAPQTERWTARENRQAKTTSLLVNGLVRVNNTGDRPRLAEVAHSGKTLVLEDIPIPDFQPDEILVNVRACGMCRSDVQLIDGYFREYADIPTPITLGHEITVGRDPSCTITIDGDTFVSALHLRIYDADGQAMVEDLGSTNGSFHNGSRLVGARPLHPGDRIQVGYTVLEAQ